MKPQYNIFKNSRYAIEGLFHALKTENSFRVEMIVSIPLLGLIFFMDLNLSYKLILIFSLFLVLIVELLNSSIENVVDLVTKEIHPLAKNAKDIASTAVMFSIVLHIFCWVLILLNT